MPEMTGSANEENENRPSDDQEEVNLEELAEHIVRLLIRELKIEDERIGKI